MIELFNIISSSFLLFLFFNGNKYFYLNKIILNPFTQINVSIILFFNVFFIFSFFKINNQIIFFLIIILCLINLSYFIKNLKNPIYLLFIFFNIFIYFQISAIPSLGWDGQSNWFPKAFNFFSGGTFFDLSAYPRPSYPHLGTYIWSIFWNNSILKYEYVGRFIYVFLYFSSLFFLLSNKNKNEVFSILSLVIIYLFTFDINLFKGYQEILIFSLINIFIIFYYSRIKLNIFFILTLLIINLIIWSKDEGLIYSIPILLFFLTTSNKLLCRTNLLFIIFFTVLVAFKFILIYKLNYDFRLQGFSVQILITELLNFSSFKQDLLLIFKHFFISYFKYPIWLLIIFFLIFPSKIIRNQKIYKNSILLFFFSFISNFLIFHVQNADMLEWYLITALDRLNFILSGFFLYFIFENIRYYLIKFNDLKN